MAASLVVYKRDWTGLDTETAQEILVDLITQPDIVAAEECGPACLQLNFKRAQYQIDNLPTSIARRIPDLVSKVRELSQIPF